MTARPLRNPGDSVNEQITDELFDQILPYVVFAMIFFSLAVWEWCRWNLSRPVSPWYMTVFAFLMIGYCSFRVYQSIPRLKSLRQGRDGEKAVGQFLEKLRSQGAVVLHDIPGDGFNIDHVILSKRGFFTVETKTRSKPEGKDSVIDVTDDGLIIDGYGPDDSYLIQACAQSKWLQSFLYDTTGKDWSIRPTIVFPGWFVNPNRSRKFKHIWILNPKALIKFFERQSDQIDQADVHLAAYNLSRYVRTHGGA